MRRKDLDPHDDYLVPRWFQRRLEASWMIFEGVKGRSTRVSWTTSNGRYHRGKYTDDSNRRDLSRSPFVTPKDIAKPTKEVNPTAHLQACRNSKGAG